MEMKLDIYKDRFCREIDRTVTANDFELSTGICEDVLAIINIDMFDGGLDALSEEATMSLAIGIVKNGFPFFCDLVKELFGVNDDEVKRTKIADIANVVIEIVKYSFTQLSISLGSKNTKN